MFFEKEVGIAECCYCDKCRECSENQLRMVDTQEPIAKEKTSELEAEVKAMQKQLEELDKESVYLHSMAATYKASFESYDRLFNPERKPVAPIEGCPSKSFGGTRPSTSNST